MRAAVLLLLLSAAPLQSQRPSPTPLTPQKDAASVIARDVIWGLKGGFVSDGTGWIDNDIEFGIDAGFSLSAFVDYRLGPKIFGSAALNVASFSGDVDSDPLRDISVLMKALVGAPDAQFLFRPALGLGYGSDGDASYLMLHAFVEMIPVRARAPWVFDVGIFAAPAGGNDAHDVSLEPRLVLRLGRLF